MEEDNHNIEKSDREVGKHREGHIARKRHYHTKKNYLTYAIWIIVGLFLINSFQIRAINNNLELLNSNFANMGNIDQKEAEPENYRIN